MLSPGLDMACGANGALLSSSLRTRVTIARAFAANTPVLLLDYPFSGHDHHTRNALVC